MTSTVCGKTLWEVVSCPSVTESDFAPPNHREMARASFRAVPIRKSMSSLLSSTAVASKSDQDPRNVKRGFNEEIPLDPPARAGDGVRSKGVVTEVFRRA